MCFVRVFSWKVLNSNFAESCIGGKIVKYKLFPFAVVAVVLATSLIVSTTTVSLASAGEGWTSETGSFTLTASGIGRRLSGVVCFSESGEYKAVFDESGILMKLRLTITSGTFRAIWYSYGAWHRSTDSLAGVELCWNIWHGEVTGSKGSRYWTITDDNEAWQIDWDIYHTEGIVSGCIAWQLDGATTIILRLRGTFLPYSSPIG